MKYNNLKNWILFFKFGFLLRLISEHHDKLKKLQSRISTLSIFKIKLQKCSILSRKYIKKNEIYIYIYNE